MQQRQRGFTLVEIAIVLVVIGLLLGGVLKGQELINSSRVRAISDQQAGVQAAFYGFQDRYRAVAGDMDEVDASEAIGQEVFLGGDGNGRLLAPVGENGAEWAELNGVWEQLSKAGFIKGSYNGDNGNAEPTADDGPVNVFNGNLILARHGEYVGNAPERLVLHMGRQVPADIARELDVKVDDGEPETGILRNAAQGARAYQADNEECTTGSDPAIWDIETNSQDCNPTFLF
ncbi:MAG: prepilin-type N-terminal cleavage/methylation domain-containing protein [Halofilum sp. (in: g-proteobacteria)]